MEKIVIIINGYGGVGKDTLCDYIASHYETINVSSITPIKEIAGNYGWNGEKDEISRKFLADLKRTFSDFNGLPTTYLMNEYEKFLNGSAVILFAHIRESDEIDKFKTRIKTPCITLLIRGCDNKSWGNCSDDDVENYTYDYYFHNEKPLIETQKDFHTLINKIVTEKAHPPIKH